jgi:hypothetical protein
MEVMHRSDNNPDVSTIQEGQVPTAQQISTLNFPNPNILALSLMSFRFDAEDFNCDVAKTKLEEILSEVRQFNGSSKPIATATPAEVTANNTLMQKTLLNMRNLITEVSSSNCFSILKGLSMHFRRQIFLLSFR